jgi:hypothetical protein
MEQTVEPCVCGFGSRAQPQLLKLPSGIDRLMNNP